ncbi:MAG: carbohydrate ABC transporter permease [Pseudomonadota bacterium]|nr:carbohydrate ABC transporter permease [Pseudomonadota bacterium]
MTSVNHRPWLSTSRWLLVAYCVYLLLPLYWLASIALQSNADITGEFSVLPQNPSLNNFAEIWRNPVWSEAFANSLSYVLLNTFISTLVAVPAAYVFSRYRFLGDRQLFFWLLTNRMAPPAVFLLPFFQLYSAVGLFDTPLAVALAHCLFTVPLSVWILEGFMSGVSTELDDMARIDGHSFGYFFLRIFVPVNRGAIGVTLFFCFMFSWVELLLARTLTGSEAKPIVVTMTRTVSASGLDWGVLAAAGVLTVIPGIIVVWFVRKHLVKGFALGRVS